MPADIQLDLIFDNQGAMLPSGLVTAAIMLVLLRLSGSRASPRDLTRAFLSITLRWYSAIVNFPWTVRPLSILWKSGSCLTEAWSRNRDRFRQLILYVLWSVAAPAVIAEGLGPLAALMRGASLTRVNAGRFSA